MSSEDNQRISVAGLVMNILNVESPASNINWID